MMKSTGIVRKLDNAGRFVMPVSLRKTLGLNNADGALEIFVEGDTVVLRRYTPACSFCDSMDKLVTYKDMRVCHTCVKKLAELAELP